jgi:hypothetical protein
MTLPAGSIPHDRGQDSRRRRRGNDPAPDGSAEGADHDHPDGFRRPSLWPRNLGAVSGQLMGPVGTVRQCTVASGTARFHEGRIGPVATRAITIDAPPSTVWPLLVQMGVGRGGADSYDWIERLFGLDIDNVARIVPELQPLEASDR